MDLKIFILILGLSELCVVAEGLFAYKDRFFSVLQMKQRGINQGLPFVAHAGMWADFFLISPMIAIIVTYHFSEWTTSVLVISICAGFFASAVMHFIYAKTDISESAFEHGALTKSGWAHFLYMAGALSVLILFYFFTPSISYTSFLIVSVLLILHLLAGNHILLEIMKPAWWSKSHFKANLLIFSVGTLILLLILRWYTLFA